MDKKLKIGIVGGDRRIIKVSSVLDKLKYDVKVWGIDNTYFETDLCVSTCEEAVSDADVVILPTPPSEDEVRINCPLFSGESGIKFYKLLELLPKKAIILGGRMSPRFKDIASKHNFKTYDYFNREELLIKNAVPTAEAAIGIAIDKFPKTLFGSHVAVLGFGRIGEALASKLNLLGAKVTVFARKNASIAKAQSMGVNGRKIAFSNNVSTLGELSQGYDIIYNTVPYWIITEDILKNISKSTLIIDLASAPGGVDIVAAKKYEINIIHALSLPAKTAPESAGVIIAESILNIIEEEGVI